MCLLLLVLAGNKFLQDHKPWEAIKSDKELCGSYLAACMGLVALLAALVEPYMPSVTRKVNPHAPVKTLMHTGIRTLQLQRKERLHRNSIACMVEQEEE